jgi:hypothetical protein
VWPSRFHQLLPEMQTVRHADLRNGLIASACLRWLSSFFPSHHDVRVPVKLAPRKGGTGEAKARKTVPSKN